MGVSVRRPKDSETYNMALDKTIVARIATLARIKVPDSELEPLAGELTTIFRLDRAVERG